MPVDDFPEAAVLVDELKVVRTSGLAHVSLTRVPWLARAVTIYFPESQERYHKARLRELLIVAAATLHDPVKTGIQLAFGLDHRTDVLNSKARREAFADHFGVSVETVRRQDNLEDNTFHTLAVAVRALVASAPTEGDTPTGRSEASPGNRDDLFGGVIHADQFRTSHSPAAYRDMIGSIEEGARRIDSYPKRLSVVFKGESAIERIAIQRFGRGSAMIDPYVEEHMLRRQTFYRNLSNGTVVREIYVAEDLRRYLLEGKHGTGVYLAQQDLDESVQMWRECLEGYPNNYLVAFTSERIPFKYEVVDGRTVVMHEAISGNDRDRLNAFAIVNEQIASHFARDFGLVWERTPASDRTLERTLAFINELRKQGSR